MSVAARVWTAIGLALGAGAANAQERPPDPAALVAAALEAHGGAELLGRWRNMTVEGRATLRFGPAEVQAQLAVRVRGGTMIRRDVEATFRGARRVFSTASTGKSAWRRMGSRVFDHPPDDLTTWLRHRPDILLRAAAAPDALAAGGVDEVDGDPVDVVIVREEGAETRILLDRATRLVRALEYRAVENAGMGEHEEVLLKKTFGDYRPVDGIPFPWRRGEYRDGVETLRAELTRVELGAEPDLDLFARPAEDEEAWEWPDQMAN